MDSGVRKGYVVPASYKTPDVLLIYTFKSGKSIVSDRGKKHLRKKDKYFYSLTPIVVVSTKCSHPWVLAFLVSNTTGSNKWINCISLDFNLCSLSEPRNPRKLEPLD